ncbi:hypothetical protein POX_a01315 [Penicillium oxalicum]|uniref:hypothetical protein n=1 Tax=Penicillium oxalicum TaxID=69781 RepID=UPI0020B706DD|nr:hypothetical protein POX_a01315 [Penicillium oxalicum]KAI2794714.1 hypothetical protein POX_a01315 [Penicillium oxalicum]
MTLSSERASSPIAGWFRSCWGCLSGLEPRDQQNEQTHSRGFEREMQPGFPPQSRSSLSLWIEDRRQNASRTSKRASMSWKKPPPTPLKIGNPSDFRRVQSFQLEPTPTESSLFQPLQLSIHRISNRLSALPSFESFCLGADSQDETPALSTVNPHSRRASGDVRFSISRKPLGSIARRTSTTSGTPISMLPPAHLNDTLVPHFSTLGSPGLSARALSLPETGHYFPSPGSRDSCITGSYGTSVTQNHAMVIEGMGSIRESTRRAQHVANQMTEKSTMNDQPGSQGSFSSSSTRTFPSRLSSLRRPSTGDNQIDIASEPLPSKKHQWNYHEQSIPAGAESISCLDGDNAKFDRFRSLSGTTFGSPLATPTAKFFEHRAKDSISSTSMGGITPQCSSHNLSLTSEKFIEAGFSDRGFVEPQPQQCPPSPYYAEEASHYRSSAIGIAF